MSLGNPDWQQAVLALQLLQIDPGLGGLCLRARAGPVRDALLDMLPRGARKLPPHCTDAALFGGLDLAGTLAAGQMVRTGGLLDRPGLLILPMAERTDAGLAARLAGVLDAGPDHTLIALDEGAEPDEALNPKLAERLAFRVDMSDCPWGAVSDCRTDPALPLGAVTLPGPMLEQITQIAADLGIDSLRAPLLAIRAARAHAALCGRTTVADEDTQTACLLTLAHRATRLPEAARDDPPPPPPGDQTGRDDGDDTQTITDDILLDAVRAMLPNNLLAQMQAGKARNGRGNGTGAARKGNRRGRPLPSRAGRISDGARIDLIATLRAAAPWQTIRRQATGQDGVQIRRDDIRIKRYEEKSDRLLIFTVDASGSAALARLGEAKGAVELLLAQAYARRDHVALVAFRGTGAELLLPPTRSLVQTKRRLADLPGGGGTPLAAGLKLALAQADQAARRGLTPTVAILTDGRANVALDGRGDRKQAAQDAQQMAQVLRGQGINAIVIDTGNRPEPTLRNLAQLLHAPYLPLPRADAARLSAGVMAALGD